jgi:sulfur dioxygenase
MQRPGRTRICSVDDASREAVIIDPVREHIERDLTLISELGVKLKHILETHVHADHVTSAGQLSERTGAVTAASAQGCCMCSTAVGPWSGDHRGLHAHDRRSKPRAIPKTV